MCAVGWIGRHIPRSPHSLAALFPDHPSTAGRLPPQGRGSPTPGHNGRQGRKAERRLWFMPEFFTFLNFSLPLHHTWAVNLRERSPAQLLLFLRHLLTAMSVSGNGQRAASKEAAGIYAGEVVRRVEDVPRAANDSVVPRAHCSPRFLSTVDVTAEARCCNAPP